MTTQEVMDELKSYGDERTKQTFLRHGAREPFYGVKVADMKKILKKTKKNHELSLELYATGNGDAMYLAGLMADENQITREQLEDWAEKADWHMISEYTVPWVAAETPFGFELGLSWIESDVERVASAGWSTLSSFAAVTQDDALDVNKYSELLTRVEREIHDAPNRVRYCMNNFVIAIGCYIPALHDKAVQTASNVGKVEVFMGDTHCKVPLATAYIQKVADRGSVGKKRKTARC